MLLGDRIEKALQLVGITKERVEHWVGGPCGCEERQEKLNMIDMWARRVLLGKTERAGEYLSRLLEEKE